MPGESVGVMNEQISRTTTSGAHMSTVHMSTLHLSEGPLAGVTVTPPLDRSEVAFLAAFAGAPVRDHDGRPSPGTTSVRRVWPGQPRTTSPWTPCAQGCCVVRTAGAADAPGVAAQWLRFLVSTFLLARHRVDGGVVVPVRGGPPEVLLVENGEVFEGLVDPTPDDPVGGRTA